MNLWDTYCGLMSRPPRRRDPWLPRDSARNSSKPGREPVHDKQMANKLLMGGNMLLCVISFTIALYSAYPSALTTTHT
jgi:hypothetical protein